MTDRVTLIPADGLKVAKPQGGHLDAKGEAVTLDSYWRRRIADGSVTRADAVKPAPAPAPAGAKK